MSTAPSIPEELWNQLPPAAQAAMLAVVATLEARIAAPEAQINQSSSKPPSSDPPYAKPVPDRAPVDARVGNPGTPNIRGRIARGPAFASYLRRFRGHLCQERTAKHFGTFCRGLLSDLPRKSIEPIGLEAGTAVRTLQELLVTARWDQASARDTLQKHLGSVVAGLPSDPLGTVGVIDETCCRKWGDHTPGVQRQYLGCVGKVDNGIVTVHLAVAKGTFQALLDADLFLPKAWAADRDRCERAGIPDDVGHQTKWRLAIDQWLRATGNGLSFDGLTFDEGYGAAVPFLTFLSLVNQRFVAEVPVNFRVQDTAEGRSRRADARLPATDAGSGTRHRVAHRTVRASFWRAATAAVWVADRVHTLVVAVNENTDEVKYFLTNATTATRARVLAVAFRR